MAILKALRSSVARRIHLSFVLAAALPLLALAVTAYGLISHRLQGQAMEDARSLAKEMGMAVFDRLKFVTDELVILARHGAMEGTQLPDLSGLDLNERVHGLFRMDVHGLSADSLALSAAESQAIRDVVARSSRDRPLMIATGAVAGRRLFLLVRAETGDPAGHFLGAELDTGHLWDTATVAARPEWVCVLDDRDAPVFCNHPDYDAWLMASRDLVASRGEPRSLLHDAGEPALTAAWSLFLKPHYQFERWTMLVGVPQSMALASIATFDRIFAGVATLALLTAFLLGRRLIRSNLGPLTTLTQATEQLTAGDFDHRVALQSGDEFQQLGDSFNGMASRIGSQFRELETLARLDRALQGAQSIDAALDAAIDGLASLIGPGRSALRCEERWREPGTHWRRGFDTAVADADGSLREIAVLRGADATADIVLRAPTPADVAAARRVGDVLGIALGNLVSERRLYHQANHDWLTGLPNRSRLEGLFNDWRADGGRPIGMLQLDLDRFKQINESMGHYMGDRLLAAVGGRLRAALPDDCVVSRIAGDQFIVMFADTDLRDLLPRLARLATCLQQELDRPFPLGMREVRLVATMGAALYPRDGDGFEAMLKSIDAASFAAKSSRRGGLLVFSEGMRDALAGRMEIEQALKGAVANNELVLHYQPVVDAGSHRVRSAEALMRWNRPGVGLVGPDVFVDVAEQSGLIGEMGSWAMREVCRQIQTWREAGLEIETVNVNVAGVQLLSDDFVGAVEGALRATGLPPQYLTLEVTETSMIGQLEAAVERLGRLREIGVHVMVDDFGTGYASLKYLKMLPVDGVKIDRLFVRDLTVNLSDQAIVAAVVSLTQASGFKLVAEGVETDAQAGLLQRCGVPLLQGYRFGRPLPAEDLQARLYREKGAPLLGALAGRG